MPLKNCACLDFRGLALTVLEGAGKLPWRKATASPSNCDAYRPEKDQPEDSVNDATMALLTVLTNSYLIGLVL